MKPGALQLTEAHFLLTKRCDYCNADHVLRAVPLPDVVGRSRGRAHGLDDFRTPRHGLLQSTVQEVQPYN